MRTGILGGTFDPPHRGHLALALAAIAQAELEQVILVPAGIPPHKARPDIAPPRHRLAMTRLLAREDKRLLVDTLELDRAGKSYTIDTLAAIAAARPRDNLLLVIGEDMAADFHTWRRAEEIMRLAPPLVAARSGSDLSRARARGMPAAMQQRLLASRIPFSPLPVSSTDIRARIAAGQSAAAMLTPAIAAYIDRHGLYRDHAVTAATRP